MKRTGLWFVFLPVALFSLSATSVAAEAPSGLMVTGFMVDQIPPNREESYPVCGETIYPNINWTWDYEQNHLGECGWDWFMVRFQGFVTVPDGVSSVRFAIASDDGGLITIDGHTFGTWSDQGCSVTYDERRTFPTGEPLPLDFWFYENGGGTCAMLFWQLNGDDQDWAIVPEWAFTTESTPTTTTSTTTVPETTVPATTTTSTTLQETSTTTSFATTSTTVDRSEPAQTTSTVDTEPPTTTTEATTTTTSQPPTQVVPVPNPDTGTTTTTTEPSPTTSVEEIEESTTTTGQSSSTTTAISVPDTSTSQPPPTTVTPPTTLPEIITPEVLEEIVTNTEEALTQLEAGEPMSQAEALSVVTNAETVMALSPVEAEQVFAALDVSELSDSQIAMLVEAVQDAPNEVREAFEQEINIFADGFDAYVPLDSVVSVGVRRTLIAVTAGTTLTVVGTKIRS